MLGLVKKEIIAYVEGYVFNLYRFADKAHGVSHIKKVIRDSFDIASRVGEEVDPNILYVSAALHDIGLIYGNRETHHMDSGKFASNCCYLKSFFSEKEILTIVAAVEDHRDSLDREPRNIYGCIVSDADRSLEDVFVRCLAYTGNDIEESLNYIYSKYGKIRFRVKGLDSYYNEKLNKLYFSLAKLELVV